MTNRAERGARARNIGAVLCLALTAVGVAAPSHASAQSSDLPAGSTACTRLEPITPAQGFDPLTASAVTLEANDFPSKPTDPSALETWRNYVALYMAGGAQLSVPCSTDQAAPSTGIFNGNFNASAWAGNIAYNETYTNVEATWGVPTSTGSGLSSHWVGIGLGNSKTYPLVQAGVESPANAKAYAWVETWYPGDPQGEVPVAGLGNIGGHLIYVKVHFATTGAVSYLLTDEFTGISYHPSAQTYSGMKPDGHAEFISEDPNGMAQPLADFNNCNFTAAQAYSGSTGWKYIGKLSHYWVKMIDGSGNVMAHPGSISSDGSWFANFFDRAT